MRTSTALALLALLASIGALAPAQPYSGDYFVTTGDCKRVSVSKGRNGGADDVAADALAGT